MPRAEESRPAIDAFVAAGSQLARGRYDNAMLRQLDSACDALMEQSALDLGYLDALLRSRPAALNGLMSVEGGILEILTDEVLDHYAAPDLADWFEECEQGITEHFARVAHSQRIAFDYRDSPETTAVFRPAAAAPGRGANAIIGDFYFVHANGFEGRVMWDRRVFDIEYPAIAMLTSASFVSELSFDAHVLPRWQPGPLFRYHPERFKQSRACYLRPVYSTRAASKPPRSNDEFMARFNEEAGRIMRESNALSLRFPLKEKLTQPFPASEATKSELELFMLYDQFEESGRQIFDLPPILAEMFRNTDVENVPLDMLHSPYQSYFLYFGPQDDLEFEEDWLVDGAYVTHIPEDGLLQVMLVSRPTDDSDIRHWHSKPEPCFVFAFDKSTKTMDVGTALDTVLSARLSALAREVAVGNAEASADIEKAQRALMADGIDVSGMHVIPNISEGAAARIEISKQRFPVFREALRLVINGICYLTAYPEDTDPQWPADAPQALREKAVAGTDKEAKRAKSKLESLGYKAVHLCGQHFRRTEAGQYESTDRSVKSGWRRGHWKRQHYGVARSLRKLQWRMPVMVNRSQPSNDPPEGHLYMIDV